MDINFMKIFQGVDLLSVQWENDPKMVIARAVMIILGIFMVSVLRIIGAYPLDTQMSSRIVGFTGKSVPKG